MINWIKKFLTRLRQRNSPFKQGDRVKDIFRPELGIGRVLKIETDRAIYPVKVQYRTNICTHYTHEGKYWDNDSFISLKKI